VDLKDRRCSDKAKADRCEVRVELNNCLNPCMEIDMFDPRADTCEKRCRSRFPMASCD